MPTGLTLTVMRKCRAGIFSPVVLPDQQLLFQSLLAGNSGVTQSCP